ncbi:MAG: 16S rRNA (cytosine(1402)-N(4))-methyltransferase RsmH [Anaerofustis stercorihominis]|nr:16S rRNA (cytosine(1402)-N(4))-methyltransferase RsmH [Anaerofustis stercorihominis]
MKFEGHIPVMYEECLQALNIKPDGVYLDMTLGGFGHGRGICERLSENGIYIGLDLDKDAIERGYQRSSDLKNKCHFVHSNYKDFDKVLDSLEIPYVDGILVDLGVSSFQLDEGDRGFSFRNDGPLDMRMNTDAPLSAKDVVNEYDETELKRIIFEYGEERFAPQIARRIIAERAKAPFERTCQLAELVYDTIPRKFHQKGRHPATKTFQAIRIEVNSELEGLEECIEKAIGRLNPAGRICIISFHSLEDKAVKKAYKKMSTGCICPKDFPVCVCNNKPKIKLINKSVYTPKNKETEENARSRSAKLRVAEKLEE